MHVTTGQVIMYGTPEAVEALSTRVRLSSAELERRKARRRAQKAARRIGR